ncbi:MAG: zinc ribbon domain-containing protein [Nitrospinota bacterium]|jgi:putative FmdB family regulatory protein|nr:zinc ribbon domain-containing protein [Nitrospinota bacterium]MDP7167269.1 zinc ribbon domain-containing protein [Nitrospinota bacterium]MDP7371182.1 zinc ribbon domain-containing protein [Nitrospinota bacterium]MDP7664929.1 zinc ribbon domain-containing protein [Nitrospinota bacterium]HJP15279.1 FmdB family zinc ribbon protein [Nitrospinota bacterium]
MPIHEYCCEACGEMFESITGTPLERDACPACGSKKLDRLVSGFAARTSIHRRGGVVDLSSNACPCGVHQRGAHAHH